MTNESNTQFRSRQRRQSAIQPPPPEPVVEAPIEPPPAPPKPVEEIEKEHSAPKTLGGSGLSQHDVVQIIDPQSRLYGGFMAVGDVRNNKVHGYYVAEGRAKHFVTIPLGMVHPIGGQAKVRSSNPCSPKWLSDNQ